MEAGLERTIIGVDCSVIQRRTLNGAISKSSWDILGIGQAIQSFAEQVQPELGVPAWTRALLFQEASRICRITGYVKSEFRLDISFSVSQTKITLLSVLLPW